MMTKNDVENMAARMSDDMRTAFGASGKDLDRTIHAWLMEAIRKAEDDARALAYEAAGRIGDSRKQNIAKEG